MITLRSPRIQFIYALGISTLVSTGLFAYGAQRNHNLEYSYLVWNLLLAWLPLCFVLRLTIALKEKLLSSWEALCFGLLWITFLPNSFYMISDFIHLQDVKRIDILFDTVMFTSFIYTGVALGFSSLYLVHLELLKRFTPKGSASLVAMTLLICSGAIYVGRDLRWNSWDILTNPGGLLFDISDRLQHPSAYPQMFLTIVSFFLLLATMYLLIWQGIRTLHKSPLL